LPAIAGYESSTRRKQNSEWDIEIGVNARKSGFSKPYAIYGAGLRLVRYGILATVTEYCYYTIVWVSGEM